MSEGTKLSVADLDRIHDKIEAAKTRKSKAMGAMEKIEEGWKRDLGVNTVEEAREKLEEMQRETKTQQQRLDDILQQLEDAADWDTL